MTLEHIPNHKEAGLALLITQYQDKPRLAALLGAFLDEAQLLEDATWEVILGRLIDDAVGAQLVTLGRLVGQEPIGADDDEFRLYIKARIAVNSSDGTGDDVMNVAALLLEGSPWTYEELYPASIIIEALELPGYAATIAHLLKLARAAGVALSLHHSEAAEADTFAFADGDEQQDDSVRGFGGDDPDEEPGGLWVGAY